MTVRLQFSKGNEKISKPLQSAEYAIYLLDLVPNSTMVAIVLQCSGSESNFFVRARFRNAAEKCSTFYSYSEAGHGLREIQRFLKVFFLFFFQELNNLQNEFER